MEHHLKYDAMRSSVSYRDALPMQQIADVLKKGSGLIRSLWTTFSGSYEYLPK